MAAAPSHRSSVWRLICRSDLELRATAEAGRIGLTTIITSNMVGAFDSATAVWPVARAGAASARFSARLDKSWSAARGPHGGYLAAVLLRALSETVTDLDRPARSLTVQYLQSPKPGEVAIYTDLHRRGRVLSIVSARIEQDGQLMTIANAVFSGAWNALEFCDLAMPVVDRPDPNRESSADLPHAAASFTRHLVMQTRLGARSGADAGAPIEAGAWIGLREPRPLDALALALYSDSLFAPAITHLATPHIAPTIELAVQFRAPAALGDVDAAELCFAHFRTRVMRDGFIDEEGTVWAPDGVVLAQSRQLAVALERR
jgi:hypothetical protein